VRTDRHLLLDENWEFARSQAKGLYILLLGDDDALVAQALECYAKTVKNYDADFLYCTAAHYWDCASSSLGIEAGNLHVAPFTSLARKVDPFKDFIQPLFKLQGKYDMHPSFFVYAKVLADRVASRTGRFHHPPLADHTALSLAALHAKSIVYLDLPLCVVGHTTKSLGTRLDHLNTGCEQFEAAWSQLPRELRLVPLKPKTYLYWNYVAESLLYVKELVPDAIDNVELDEVAYFRAIFKELHGKRKAGFDVDQHLNELMKYLDSRRDIRDKILPSSGGGLVKTAEQGLVRITVRRVRRIIGDLGARKLRDWVRGYIAAHGRKLTAPGSKAGSDKGHPGFQVSGASAGLHNILECAEYLSMYGRRFLEAQP